MRSVTTMKALTPRTYAALFASSAALLTVVACGNHKNDASVTTPTPQCINSCVPDLGPRPMTQRDCDDAEAGLEFLPLPIWDMGPVIASDGKLGLDGDHPALRRAAAVGMYYYDDKTALFRIPGKIWEPPTEVAFSGVPPYPINGEVRAGWIPPGKYDEMTQYWANRPPLREAVGRCGEKLPYPDDPAKTNAEVPTNVHYALHVAGGPFIEWGGGMGRMIKCMNTDSTVPHSESGSPWNPDLNINKYLCANRRTGSYYYASAPDINGSMTTPGLAACTTSDATPTADGKSTLGQLMQETCPARDKYRQENGEIDETDEPHMAGMALDLSKWEGIAFWARRSPNSQDGLRIAVADKFVDDDMSYLSERLDQQRTIAGKENANHPRSCERKVICGCQNNKPCTPVKAVHNIYDMNGTRVRWSGANGSQQVRGRIAVDGPRMDAITSQADIDEIRLHRHSLIDLGGDAVRDPATNKELTFDDGETVKVFNGFGGLGQPFDSDVLVPVTASFCFDPNVDPVPPDGTPLGQIIDRGYQNNRITAATGPVFQPRGPFGFFTNQSAPLAFDPKNGVPEDQHTQADYQLWPSDTTVTEVPGYQYQMCGKTACDYEYSSLQAADPQSFGRECKPFPFKGGITYSYCFNPGEDPDPPEGTQQCGDFWLKPVALSTDWEFYKVPFSSLIQQGWAKRFYEFDLKNITNVRFQWDRGWIDFWISDVRFYRTKQQQ
jgi:hypothetical protein